MKNNFSIFLVLILLLMVSPGYCQNQITITYSHPPLNTLNQDALWNFKIKNNTSLEINFYLSGKLSEKKAGLIATGKTTAIKILPNENKSFTARDLPQTPEINYVSPDPRYKEALQRGGNLPNGEYEICIIAKNPANNEEISLEECIEQNIESVFESEITLLSPEKGEKLDSLGLPLFSWTEPIPKPQDEFTYNLRIVEAEQNQNPNELIQNKQFFNEFKYLRTASYAYKQTEKRFKKDKTYYWFVTVTIGNEEKIKSSLNSFTYTSTSSSSCYCFYPPPFGKFCAGQIISIRPSGNCFGSVTWNITPANNITPSSGNSSVISFTAASPGTYVINYTVTYPGNSSCQSYSDRMTVNVISSPVITAVNQGTLCYNSSQTNIAFNSLVNVSPSGGVYNYKVDGAATSSSVFNPSVMSEGMHSIEITYTYPAPVFPMVTGCPATITMPVYISNANAAYNLKPLNTIICEGTSQLLYLEGIPQSLTGFTYRWFIAPKTGSGACPTYTANTVPSAPWSEITGVNSPNYNTALSLPPGKYCYFCLVESPCHDLKTSNAVSIEVQPRLVAGQLTADNSEFCSIASSKKVKVTQSGQTGIVTWATSPVVTDLNSAPNIFEADLTSTTTFTTTISGCQGQTFTNSLTVKVSDPPPAAVLCIQPHIINPDLSSCCPYPDPCTNYLELQDGCDAIVSLKQSDGTFYPASSVNVKWSYTEISNFSDWSSNFLSNFQNNIVPSSITSAEWTPFIPNGDNRYWNSNPVHSTTIYKVEITGASGCPTQVYFGGLFVVRPVLPFGLQATDVFRDIPCGNNINLNFNLDNLFTRPDGFKVNYEWKFRPSNNPTANSLQSDTWIFGTGFPSTPVNITQEGTVSLTISNGCTSYTQSDDIYYENPLVGIEPVCCTCKGQSFNLKATDGFSTYQWIFDKPVTYTNMNSSGSQITVNPGNASGSIKATVIVSKGACLQKTAVTTITICPQ